MAPRIFLKRFLEQFKKKINSMILKMISQNVYFKKRLIYSVNEYVAKADNFEPNN